MPFSNSIYIFIEGNDDKDFLEKILKPLIKSKYNKVIHPIKYSEKRIEKTHLNREHSLGLKVGPVQPRRMVTQSRRNDTQMPRKCEIDMWQQRALKIF